TAGYRFFQKAAAIDHELRLANLERLRELRYGHDDVSVFCAHDPAELAALSG
ncbi:MAG: MBL fold metallo-hydrolase, partial [Gammaproteobacteria bacterium]|nr:MBL fold metallo-hydrolase [Gammaproteobacteria bacterium]